ncbi:MAG TPA: Stp1/IreP family PP2C-type Ser/Thr phosphatase [Solirubrobacteraceae bacterium]|jgi:protein phosphatase
MIRVAEHVARTDTGHQRATNEDSYLERAPLFVVADGMGGAQAGEVASQLAIGHFAGGLPGEESEGSERRLTRAVLAANAEIHALSEADPRRAGMGTTLTAAYVGRGQVSFAHVGDSRAYRLRDGELERITEDHSLVEELLRQGRLTEEEAEEHPQRSIITRALGPEPEVEVDTFTVAARDGDVYLICSDGLTSMVAESAVAEIMREAPDIVSTAERLVAAALEAGGRDNITVVLFRIEEVGGVDDPPTEALAPASVPPEDGGEAKEISDAGEAGEADPAGAELRAERSEAPTVESAIADAPEPRRLIARHARSHRRSPRMPRPGAHRRGRHHRLRRRLVVGSVVVVVLGAVAIGALLAAQSVYFVGTDANGQVTVFNGLPYALPGGVRLYTSYFVSGVTVAELSKLERGRLFNNELRSQQAATHLVSQLELDQIAGQ